jgi:predicted dehydrogenase
MSAKIRIGVIGTSWYSEFLHVAKIKELSGADLIAICGRNRIRAEELAANYSIAQVYTDYQEMIERANLQALVVAAPDDLHYPITMAALEAGLHVLCEKPMALKGSQAKAMLEKAQAVGVKHMVCFTYRWIPAYKYLKQLLDQGYLGRCYQINFHFVGDYGNDEYSWHVDKKRSDGPLGDFGSHLIDLALWYVGEIAQVSGQLSTFMNRIGPDGQAIDPAIDAAIVALQFANGAQGVIQLSAVAQVGELGNRQHAILYGEEGTLEVTSTSLGGAEMRGVRRGEQDFHNLEIPQELFGTNDRNAPFEISKRPSGDQPFIDAILFDRIVEPSFVNGYKVQMVMDAAKESHQQGKWISIK